MRVEMREGRPEIGSDEGGYKVSVGQIVCNEKDERRVWASR
jgi:hypothetical protein